MPAIFNFLHNNTKFFKFGRRTIKYCVDIHGENRNKNYSNLYNNTKYFLKFSG